MREESPWSCFVCDPAPLNALRETCSQLQTRRERLKARGAERLAKAKLTGGGGAPAASAQGEKPRGKAASDVSMADFPADLPRPRSKRAEEEEGTPLVLWPPHQQKAGKAPKAGGEAKEAKLLPAVSVVGRLAQHLKPHQVAGIKFMWAACLAQKRQDMQTKRRVAMRADSTTRAQPGTKPSHKVGTRNWRTKLAHETGARNRRTKPAHVVVVRSRRT